MSVEAYARQLECNRRWQSENPERQKENIRRWLSENPERKAEYNREYYEANKAKRLEYIRAWQQANPDKVRAIGRTKDRRDRERKASGTWTDLTHLDRIDYPESCYICGTSAPGLYEIEHIIPVSRWEDYSVTESGLRLACKSCNASKGAKDPAAYVLERFHTGLPVLQSIEV